jgi:D-inositol-3-phosphate glycosyltransferase
MKIAMVSEHASPLTTGRSGPEGGQRGHVAGPARALGRMGHHVTVYTRRQAPDVRDRARLAPGSPLNTSRRDRNGRCPKTICSARRPLSRRT